MSAGRMEIAGVKSVSRYEWILSLIGSAGGIKASTFIAKSLSRHKFIRPWLPLRSTKLIQR